MEMTNEKILHVKAKWDEIGFTKFPENFDIVGAFKELREWFKWDMKKYPYDNITNPVEYNISYPETNCKLKDDLHDATVMSIIGILNYAENQNLTNNLNYEKIDKIIYGFDSFYVCDGDLDGYYNYFKVLLDTGVSATDASYIGGTIRNRMGNDDFETFFGKYKAILQKHILGTGNLADDPSVTTINTTATTVVEPKYIPSSNTTATPVDETVVTNQAQVTPVAPAYQPGYNVDPYTKVRAKFGFVPLAHVALQRNPVGCWFYDNQLGIYRSQFVDYHKLNCMADKVTARKYIESITKIMSNPVIYEEILQHMPVIGTKFKDTEPVLLKFISGSSIYSTKYAIGCEYGEHSLVFVCDVITNTINADYFGKTAEVSVAVNNFRV